jgi:hypothetical protein
MQLYKAGDRIKLSDEDIYGYIQKFFAQHGIGKNAYNSYLVQWDNGNTGIVNEDKLVLIDKEKLRQAAKEQADRIAKMIEDDDPGESGRTLLSLFDYSGAWSEPFMDAGWDVIHWDIKLDEFCDVNNIDSAETALELFENVDGILAAVPCTDFAVSGAQYWPKKDESGQTALSIELVRQVQRLANLFTPTDIEYEGTFFWSMENPVGRIGKLFPELGQPYYFNPCDFAGYLNLTRSDHNELDRIRRKDGMNVTREEVEFVIKCEAYTKKTGLWGDFNHKLIKYPVEPVRTCKQGSPIQTFGGKSSKTKEERSYTPRGFAKAFYNANRNYRGDW